MIRRFLPILVIAFAIVLSFGTPIAHAANAADWKAGKIIDDSVFFNSSLMSTADIQNFLNAQVPSCDTWGQKIYSGTQTRAERGASKGYPAPYVCVKDYQENPITHETNLSTAGNVSGGWSAAQIIKYAADTYGINPKALIVLLQKEQGLVTDDWPWTYQYRSATGYGCPDTAPCDAQYYGFYNQVTNAAAAFKRYAANPQSYRYKAYQNNAILYNPDSTCGSSSVYLQNQATTGLYVYTPYQPNQAALSNLYGTGDDCSAYGNRNFWRIYSDWFGTLTGPAAFTVQGSNKIYVPIGQYKYLVPYAAAMQDYGISWEAVQTVGQQYVDAIPSPPPSTGLSSSISHVIKSPDDADADGGSLYLISRGKRYQFQSMQQFYDFGFTESDISYLPLVNILDFFSSGALPNFITSPYGSVFKIINGQKRIIFEYTTYIRLNPSDTVAALSYYLTDKIASGTPITDRPILLKYSSGDSLLYYSQDNYAAIPTYELYQCAGFETTNKTPVFRLAQNSYIANVTNPEVLSCTTNLNGTTYMLNYGYKSEVSSTILPTSGAASALQAQIISSTPNASRPLSSYVKISGDAGVWYLSGGKRRVIPTYNTFRMMGISDTNIDTVQTSNLEGFAYDGFQLAYGQIVKDTSSAAVYVSSSNHRYSFPTSDLFLAYKNSWGGIDTLDSTTLGTNYPVDGIVSPIIANKSTHIAYAVATNGCFLLSTDTLAAFGKTQTALETSQPYNSDIFTSVDFAKCKSGTNFIKIAGQSVVYWMSDGTRYPLATYSAMLRKNSGTEPVVMTLDSYYVNSLSTGSPVY